MSKNENAALRNAAQGQNETRERGQRFDVSAHEDSTARYLRQLAKQTTRRARLTDNPQRARKFQRLAAFLIREVLG